jgi:uncharacterized repeat protein (TIGR03803 family)
VVRDPAGNLFGTAYGGGAGAGVVYTLDAAGHQTVLYSFTGGPDGGEPYAGVIRDSAGNLYGTTFSGGTAGYNATGYAGFGVVYKLDASGQERVLHIFRGGPGGSDPSAGVIRDSDGNLYGTTFDGGAEGYGVVYKVDTTHQETALYTFAGGADGGNPQAGVIRDSAGNLYGTTEGGGAYSSSSCYAGCGVVYRVDTAGQETVLYSFTGGADGGDPQPGVIRDSAGNLYGTAYVGGTGYGVVYKLDTTGHETVLHSFTGGADGGSPNGVILDPTGSLYGTTQFGGIAGCGELLNGCGTVFKVDPIGRETVLYNFTGGADGAYPSAGVILDQAGNLYGTTRYGGVFRGFSGFGVVYKLAAGQETVLYSFPFESWGNPSGVIRDSAGNLYGTTLFGGNDAPGCAYEGGAGCGMVYKLDTAGQLTVLYGFAGPGGGNPASGVILDSAGNLYGTTEGGGKQSTGVLFKLEPGVIRD